MTLSEVKTAISSRAPVIYRGLQYYVTACIMRYRDGEWRYSLELHDLKVNSVTIAQIEDVNLTGVNIDKQQ